MLEICDDRLMQAEDLLAAVGYEPIGFTQIEDARTAFARSPERFDAALVGHFWPPEALLALTTELRRMAPDLPILLATSMNDSFGATALVNAGVSDVISWPIKATEIALALNEHLQQASRRPIIQTVEEGL